MVRYNTDSGGLPTYKLQDNALPPELHITDTKWRKVKTRDTFKMFVFVSFLSCSFKFFWLWCEITWVQHH